MTPMAASICETSRVLHMLRLGELEVGYQFITLEERWNSFSPLLRLTALFPVMHALVVVSVIQ